MNSDDSFDPKKDKTIKLLTGAAAGSLLLSVPAVAAVRSGTASYGEGDIVDCTLISRADLSRAYLLMQNNQNSEIVVARFNSRSIQFDGTTLDMAEAYVEPVIIPPNDRVMVRLNVAAGLNSPVTSDVADLNSTTRYLPQGTRVVAIRVRMIDGVGIVETTPTLV